MKKANLQRILGTNPGHLSRNVYAVAAGLSIPAKARADTLIEEQVCEAVQMMFRHNDLRIASPGDLKQLRGFVQSAYFSDHFEDQLLMSSVIQSAVGWTPSAGWRVEAGGATGGCAVQAAAMAIASGLYDYAIILGWEKMSQVTTPQATEFIALAADQTFDFSQGGNYTGFYAALANEHISQFGTTRTQMAKVVVKNRNQAQFNPFAQTSARNPFKTASASGFLTLSDVLSDKRPSCAPIRPVDCSLMSDAASALLLCSEDLANEISDHPIRLAGLGTATDVMRTGDRSKEHGSLLRTGAFLPNRNILLPHEESNPEIVNLYEQIRYPAGHSFMAGRIAAITAYEMAGISDPREQIKWFEIHDAFSSAEIQAIEAFGLAPFGMGGKFVDTGEWDSENGRFQSDFPSFSLDGKHKVHVNISGGLIGARHGIGDTGVFQTIDAIWRLQGKIKKFYGSDAFQPQVEAGSKAATESHGGTGCVVAVSIWERPAGLPEYRIDPNLPSVADESYERIQHQRLQLDRVSVRKQTPPSSQSDVLSPTDPIMGFRYKNATGASIVHSQYKIDYYKTRGRISPFFDGLADGKCLATYCPLHGVYMPPVAFCREPECYKDISDDWTDISKEVGLVQTWTSMHYTGPSFKGQLPFVNILVEYPGRRNLKDVITESQLANSTIMTSVMSRLMLPNWMNENDIFIGMPVVPHFNDVNPSGRVTDVHYVPAFTQDEWELSIKRSVSADMKGYNSPNFSGTVVNDNPK